MLLQYYTAGTHSSLAPNKSLTPNKLLNDKNEPVFYKLGWQVKLPENAELAQRESFRNRFAAAMQAEGIAIDAGFRGFAQRASSRCRKVGSLANAQIAAAGTLVLHHPILLQSEGVIEQLAKTFSEVAGQLSAIEI